MDKRTPIFIFFSLLIAGLLTSCSKDFHFKGYTPTNLMGQVMGTVDEDDWQLDDDWGNSVHKLFDETFQEACSGFQVTGKKSADSLIETISGPVIMAYPNPAQEIVSIYFRFQESGNMQLILVNESQDVIIALCEEDMQSNTYTLNVGDIDERGQLYRVFYKHNSSNHTYYGHGDLFLK